MAKNTKSVTPLFESAEYQTASQMTNKIKVLFWFRRSQNSTTGKGAIMCRVTLNNERIEIGSTGLLCTAKDWNAETQKFKTSLSSWQQANITLANIQNDLLNIYLHYEAQKKKLTPHLLKAIYKGEVKLNPTFDDVVKRYFAEKLDLSQNSKVSYRNKCKVFKRFCEASKIQNIEVSEMTPKFMNKFWVYMMNEGYSKSYAKKAREAIKSILWWACELEVLTENPLSSYRPRVKLKLNVEYLTEFEYELLINHKFNVFLQPIADCFIFCCETGLEYSGILRLNFQRDIETVENRICLVAERLKTGVERFVPLTERALTLIEKYRHKNKFPVGANQYMNRELKEIAKQCGIERRLYWHLARKTFADRCLNVRLMSVEATTKAMGQSSLNSIRPYAKTDQRRVLQEFK